METLGNQIMPKLCLKFVCKNCDYSTRKKSSFDKHVLSAKHKNRTNVNNLETNGNQIMPKLCDFQNLSCKICERSFKNRSGLWKHNKVCKEEKIPESTDKEIIMMLIKDNSEMKKMMMEIIKNGTHNTTHNNSHNKTFNLQIFLNEECKDAININDFISSIQLQVKDLEETGQLGYVEGISKVVIDNLNALNVHLRPIHCSDYKREIIYIKDNEEWTKDNENKDKMKNVIKQVANKNIKQIPEWIKLHPDCFDSDSKQNDRYLKIVSNSMSGSTEEEQKSNINKIISKVAKEIIITK
uniref:C2H2-type domain-containing protein n=1 Tax=viral metagenome TaxID=1070528 RepID=A0A6C0KRY2_9ZZZZ